MIIVHDHPCPPISVPGRKLVAKTFTYDCDCGRLMIVESCDPDQSMVAFGSEFYIELNDGRKVKPSGYIEI